MDLGSLNSNPTRKNMSNASPHDDNDDGSIYGSNSGPTVTNGKNEEERKRASNLASSSAPLQKQ